MKYEKNELNCINMDMSTYRLSMLLELALSMLNAKFPFSCDSLRTTRLSSVASQSCRS